MSKKKTIAKKKLGNFKVRLSEAKVTIQTVNENWSVSFYLGTAEYSLLAKFITENEDRSLEMLISVLYCCNAVITNTETLSNMVDYFTRDMNKEEVSEETEKESLESVKKLENGRLQETQEEDK